MPGIMQQEVIFPVVRYQDASAIRCIEQLCVIGQVFALRGACRLNVMPEET